MVVMGVSWVLVSSDVTVAWMLVTEHSTPGAPTGASALADAGGHGRSMILFWATKILGRQQDVALFQGGQFVQEYAHASRVHARTVIGRSW